MLRFQRSRSCESRIEGDCLRFEAILETIWQIYATAGVTVPVSESKARMPWHSLRHTFGTELAARASRS